MKAILLAAGLGTRLRPVTEHVPKCLVPIRRRPLLAYWLDLLGHGGFEQILVNTHYMPDKVQQFVAESPWRDRVTLAHETTLLGTGGTVLANREFIGGDSVLVAHADNLTRFDVRAFVHRHARRPPGVHMTMMTFDTDTPQSCGIVETDERGVVTAFHEKVADPPGTRANGAVYIFTPRVVAFMSGLGKKVVDLSTEVVPEFLGAIQTFHNDDYHRDIGTLASLRRAEKEFVPNPAPDAAALQAPGDSGVSG